MEKPEFVIVVLDKKHELHYSDANIKTKRVEDLKKFVSEMTAENPEKFDLRLKNRFLKDGNKLTDYFDMDQENKNETIEMIRR